MRKSGNLLNGITPRKRRVTNDDAANPRPTLIHRQPRTSGGSGSVPGGARECTAPRSPTVYGVSNRDRNACGAGYRPPPTLDTNDSIPIATGAFVQRALVHRVRTLRDPTLITGGGL